MRRWIKTGSKGIALIHKDRQGKPSLSYVFDLADTRPAEGAKIPWQWQMREEHHKTVLTALSRHYGAVEGDGIGEQLMELARRAVWESCQDHLKDLRYDVGDSLLEELDDLNLEVRFRDVLTASVQYALLSRCGLNPADYLEDADLQGITEFSTPAALHHLGDAASELSMQMLQQVERSVKQYEREKARNQRNFPGKGLAKPDAIRYTEDRQEFNTVNRESNERGVQDGTDVYEGRRLPDSRPDFGRGGGMGGGTAGQVRSAAGAVSPETPPRDVQCC